MKYFKDAISFGFIIGCIMGGAVLLLSFALDGANFKEGVKQHLTR